MRCGEKNSTAVHKPYIIIWSKYGRSCGDKNSTAVHKAYIFGQNMGGVVETRTVLLYIRNIYLVKIWEELWRQEHYCST